MRDTFGQFVALCFLILAASLGLWYADSLFFAPGRTPPCREQNLPEGRVCLETALEQWGEKIVWIDARDQSSYERGHITLAPGRSFPLRRGPEYEELLDQALERMLDAGSRGECVIVFSGREHSAAEEIAQALRDLEMLAAPVYVLEDGWERLKESRFLVP
ncbi:MAG: rhodanese-like domain-containing protein [Akkermansiaceae bacterium]|nr:rhodanese-like domain-containing protein [Akkermansia sp.]MCD7799397.1 rhodanese-like domain-containing protein [Akkermansiaceae bacterium]MCD8069872.1 rhodanese-like domain-containing protein [Akkermansiaceae bacterium]